MAEQDLKLKASISGAQETAQALYRVTAEQYELAQAVLETTQASQRSKQIAAEMVAAYQAQGQSAQVNSLAMRELVSLLREINPGFGEFADVLRKGTNLAKDLADGGLGLKDVFNTLKDKVGDAQTALGLLGAGGAVAASIYVIVAAAKSAREEFNQVTESIKKAKDALNEFQDSKAESAQSIEGGRDAGRHAPFTAEQAGAASDTFTSLRGRPELGFLEDSALQKALSTVGGSSDRAGGGNFDTDQISRIVALIQQGKLSDDVLNSPRAEKRISRTLNREDSRLDAIFERESSQGGVAALRAGAMTEMQTPEGSNRNLRALAQMHGGPGSDPDWMAAIAQVLPGIPETRSHTSNLQGTTQVPLTAEEIKRAVGEALSEMGMGGAPSDAEMAGARQMINHFHYQNSRITVPTAADQKRMIRNGDNQRFMDE